MAPISDEWLSRSNPLGRKTLPGEVRGRVRAKKLCHNCDTKLAFAAQTDFFDRSHLLILRKVIENTDVLEDSGLQVRPPILFFSITCRHSVVLAIELAASIVTLD